jgi:YggT family protein
VGSCGSSRVVDASSLDAPLHARQFSLVNSIVLGFDVVIGALRVGFFAAAAVLTVVCGIDWAVRTRKISPFSGVARFFRSSVDPLIAPVERRIVRAGGVPSSAPWWALAFVVLAGIILITLLGFIRNQLLVVTMAAGAGPGMIFQLLVTWTFAILRIALLVRVICSWIRISPYSPWVRWAFALTEPILRPLRQIVPTLGMIDITPIVAYFVLYLLESLLLGMMR